MIRKTLRIIAMVTGFALTLSIGGNSSFAAGVDRDEPQITDKEIAEANTREKIFSRHKSMQTSFALTEGENYDYKYEMFGMSKSYKYFEYDFIYDEATINSEGKPENWENLYTENGRYARGIENGKEEYYSYWYAMKDDEASEYINEYFSNNTEIEYEEIESVKKLDNGTLSVIKKTTYELSEIFTEVPDEWKGGIIEYEYILDEENLDIQEINCILIVDEKTISIASQKITYDVAEPEKCASLRAFSERVCNDEPKNPRTITVIYNPGEADEETFSKVVDSDYFVSTYTREGYSLYDDPEGTIKHVSPKEKTDVTIYAIKDEE